MIESLLALFGGSWIKLLAALAGTKAFGSLANFGLSQWGQSIADNKNEDMYNKYFSPSAQMSQMRAAGVSPAAAAQSISGVSSGTSILGSSNPSSFSSSSDLSSLFGSSIDSLVNLGGLSNSDKITDSQVHLTAQQIKESQSRIEKLNKEGKLDDKALEWFDRLNEDLLKTSQFQRDKIASEIEVLNKQSEQITAVIDNITKDTDLKDAQIRFYKDSSDKIKAEIGFIDDQSQFVKAQTLLVDSQRKLTDSQTDNSAQDLLIKKSETTIKQYEEALSQFYWHYLDDRGKPWNSDYHDGLSQLSLRGFIDGCHQIFYPIQRHFGF